MERIFSVFVSSTFEDLQTERRIIADVLLNCDCFPRGMELFTANARKPWDVISKEIYDCDFYLLLIAGRYGSYCDDKDVRNRNISFTQREFEYAESLNKPIITFIHRNWRDLPQDKKHIDWEKKNNRADHEKQDKLDKFIDLACDNTRRTFAHWSDVGELKFEVQRAITSQIRSMNEIDGWIRANRCILNGSQRKNYAQKKTTTEKKDETQTITEIEEANQFIQTFRFFKDDSTRIEHMENCDFSTHRNVLKNEDFVFSLLTELDIEKHTSSLISEIINFICYGDYNYKFDKRVKNHYQQEALDSLIALLQSGISMKNYGLFKSTISLVAKFNLYDIKIVSDEIIGYLQKYSNIQDIKFGCIHVMEHFRGGEKHTWLFNKLYTLLKTNERNDDNFPLTPKEAISLLVNILGEEDFEKFYDIFTISNYKKYIAESFIGNKTLGDDVMIFMKPKVQRLFIAFYDTVLDLNDDELAADMLSYCIFFRVSDIFTADEILEKAATLSDDIFQLFIQNFDGFLWEYREFYVKELILKIDKEKVIRIIKKKNHPRKNKLIQFINERYAYLHLIND